MTLHRLPSLEVRQSPLLNVPIDYYNKIVISKARNFLILKFKQFSAFSSKKTIKYILLKIYKYAIMYTDEGNFIQ